MYKLLSFDVYGTLINTTPVNVKAFRLILEQAGGSNIDALTFYQFWESRNIVHYLEPYRSYREIGELSLEEAFENFGVLGGTAGLIGRYFELFPRCSYTPTCCRHSKGWPVGTGWPSYRTSTTTSSGPLGFVGNLISSVRPSEPAVTSLTARCFDTSSRTRGSRGLKSCTRVNRSSPTWSAAAARPDGVLDQPP